MCPLLHDRERVLQDALVMQLVGSCEPNVPHRVYRRQACQKHPSVSYSGALQSR